IKSYCISFISKILPLDDDTLSQIVDYALNNLHSQEEVQNHFINLIGQDPESLEFITRLQSMLFGGNDVEEEKSKSKIKDRNSDKDLRSSAVVSLKQHNTVSKGNVWNQNLKNSKDLGTSNKQRLSKNNSSSTTSELLDKKPAQAAKNAKSKSTKKRTLNNLKDVEAALLQLEINSSDPTLPQEQMQTGRPIRVCNCMATKHPLFEFYPNCLNCGKIICAKEGLQPCSFCGKELLSDKEKLEIMNILTREKIDLENKGIKKSSSSPGPTSASNENKKKKYTILINSLTSNSREEQDKLFKKIEAQNALKNQREQEILEEEKKIAEQKEELKKYSQLKDKDPELIKAQERLDNLLNFQSAGAERTKIIDQASDFELPNQSELNVWASPMERALQLKKQQRQLRKQEELIKERSGRGRKVLDLSIRDGKVFVREEVTSKSLDDDENVDDEDDEDKDMKHLEKQIANQKLLESEKNFQNVWDYDKDKSRWEAPIYI
ncbi:hypothetical protein PACTADRAFT_19414, partial [Pachysolen tannophilus NRRL Y-2460]